MEAKFLTPKPKTPISRLNTQDTLTKSSRLLKTPPLVRSGEIMSVKSALKFPPTPLKPVEDQKPVQANARPREYTLRLRAKEDRSVYQVLAYAFVVSVAIVICLDTLTEYYEAPTYCDTHQECPPDTRCPPQGFCIGGALTCAKGYTISHNVCIEDSNLARRTYETLDALEGLIYSQAPEVCGDEFCFTLSKKSAEFLLSVKGVDSAKIIPRLFEVVSSKLGTKIESAVLEGIEIFKLTLPQSRLSKFAQKAVVVIGLVCCVRIILMLQDLYASYTARRLYQELKLLVIEITEGLPEQHLKEQLYLQFGFDISRWPLVEALRKADIDICRYEAIKGARPIVYWQKRKTILL
mmetsp:Transcript_2119/g.5243  ORF Transcript_2119/g.5243 Transcript_2119/m.5243 type:complete len:351 (+) Transcript_2119:763-1815(+)